MVDYYSRPEALFMQAQSFFHLHTTPIEDDIVIRSEKEYSLVNNMIAIAAVRNDCKILAYAIMSNHFHFILEGLREDCLAFFEDIKTQMMHYFVRHGRGTVIKRIQPGMTPIQTLKQLLNEIAYVIRNPFVVREDVNPLAYRWCSGFLYFNPLLDKGGIPASRLKGRALREFTCSRILTGLDPKLLIKEGVANPASFVDYERTMEFFGSARKFIMQVFKNVEGQVETALRLGELPLLNDEELLSLTFKLCRSLFRTQTPKELSLENKKRLALKLKNEYGASNGQVARCSNLAPAIVNEMFPLAAKTKYIH